MYNGKQIRIYHHNFLSQDKTWIFTVMDQIKTIEDCGILDIVDEYHVTLSGTQEEIDNGRRLFAHFPFAVIHEVFDDCSTDDLNNALHDNQRVGKPMATAPTLHRIWDDSQSNDFYMLQFHNKGSTHFERLYKNCNDVERFLYYHYWRKFLEWGCIENWKTCIQALDSGYDTAGCALRHLFFPHYSGYFWWSKSEYIRTLDDIEDCEWWRQNKGIHNDRMLPEMWLTHKTNKIFNFGPDVEYPAMHEYAMLRKYYV